METKSTYESPEIQVFSVGLTTSVLSAPATTAIQDWEYDEELL